MHTSSSTSRVDRSRPCLESSGQREVTLRFFLPTGEREVSTGEELNVTLKITALRSGAVSLREIAMTFRGWKPEVLVLPPQLESA